LIAPFACWFFAAAAQRYKVNIVQTAGLALTLAFISYYLVPYCQYGRSFRLEGAPISETIKINFLLLSNLDSVRAAYVREEDRYAESDNVIVRYYNHPQGFADRLQMISPDDIIINATENNGAFGILPTLFSFENNIPHFLWPNKPIVNFGNVYAHEVGMIADESDVTTGISFSPSGDIYHQAKWVGVLVLLPALLFMLFLITDSCCGDTRESPFALLALIIFLHAAPEGGGEDIIRNSTFGILMLLILAFVSTKLMPVLADVLVGAVKDPMGTGRVIQSQPAGFVSPATVQGMRDAEVPLSTYRWSKPTSRK
jgi:hypothetical protein